MSSARLAVMLSLATVVLSSCGGSAKPVAGSGSRGRGVVDDPRTTEINHVKCLKAHHLPVVEVGATSLQVGPLPGGPTIVFEPTPGIAQGDQVSGQMQGAETIGNALLFPNQAPDPLLKQVETCIAMGVPG